MLHTKTLNIIKATTGLITALLLLTAVHCSAQVSIAPTALFFNKQQQFRSLHVKNGSKQAQEISISMNFGYPATQNGHLIIAHDSALARKSSMADWMKAFPKHFTLQPQQRQVVRFIARPPQNLTPGGYWARVKIRSNPVSPPIDSMQAGKVGAQISIIINQVIGAHFRTQHAQTGIKVSSVDFTQADSTDTGKIMVAMQRTGNAPFMGMINVKVTDGHGKVVYQTKATNSVYTSLTRTFRMDLSNIEPGPFTISGTINTNRSDISADNLLQIKPVSFKKQITIE